MRRGAASVAAAAALVVAAGSTGGAFWLARSSPAAATTPASTWFAPYVDVTATPLYQFQDPASDPAGQIVLGFVDAPSGSTSCTPAWSGRYGLTAAETSLQLDRRVLAYRSWGGNVIVSFGGPGAIDLAVACPSASALAAAYGSVVQRYGAGAIDVDLAPATLDSGTAVSRCAAALALLRRQRPDLAVWLSLPVSPAGLDGRDESAVRSVLAAHVPLAGIDAMAMDFGDGSDPPASMLAAVEGSLAAVHAQLGTLLHGAKDAHAVWRMLGVTVMIGGADLPGEALTVTEAEDLAAFARRRAMARVSMWSLGRDAPCGRGAPPSAAGWAGACSGIGQGTLEFTTAFDRLRGTAAAVPFAAPPLVVDSPATDPYPQWRPGERYQAGYLVVWQGSVYEAKWYSDSVLPGAPVGAPSQTPWVLVGPVLPGDRAPALPTLPAGTYPAWSSAVVYKAGARVLYQGLPYAARYWTKGHPPVPDPLDPFSAPWRPLWTVAGEP